jgi:acetyltransferase EpsM
MKPLVIKGASSHGAVVAEAAASQWKVVGFVDNAGIKPSASVFAPLIGQLEQLPALLDIYNVHNLFIAIGDNFQRREVVERVRAVAPNLNFPAIVHPSAIICHGAEIGEGAIVCAGAVVGTGAKVGAFAIVNTGASLDHHAMLGDFSSMAPASATGGNVRIGSRSHIGMGVMVHHGVHIGNDVLVSSLSLVNKDLPDRVMAMGLPARVVRTREPGERYL